MGQILWSFGNFLSLQDPFKNLEEFSVRMAVHLKVVSSKKKGGKMCFFWGIEGSPAGQP